MENKKIPMRTCIACRSEKPKRELIRIVKTSDNQFKVDRTGKLNGRGAYLCDDKACLEKIIKKKLLKVAFGVEVPDSVYLELSEEFFGKE
ncbi:MAG: YlxR family protein [Clostridiales bacterium]|nr:YlxR family protein [Clostridiales bacterium]